MELLIIAGPTASGKTQISLDLAKELNGEIISADSMQVYKYMDIGTAKIKNKQGIPHHLIDIVYPDYNFSVADFQKNAKTCIEDIKNRGKLPILVGGSGFYINSILYNTTFDENSKNIEYRNELYKIEEKLGTNYLYNMLQKLDKKYADANQSNKARLVRGLVYFYETGKKISDYIEQQKKEKNNFTFNSKLFILDMERETLYKNINRRVEIMIDEGLVNEVKSLLDMGYSKESTSMSSIGYKEMVNYIDRSISIDNAINNIKQNTRRFAKRQITWFKNKTEGIWIENKTEKILSLLKK
ncbi:MAG: tRNA (adenosine(37)-N6)-dimethylallyltransferase MiaA [Defluviitaleaceae bacterium]|nr:tRNA (adenosine(37)-N6)-dimethylallyltransferase MiaA [Defluviitaleaceae bacterium]